MVRKYARTHKLANNLTNFQTTNPGAHLSKKYAHTHAAYFPPVFHDAYFIYSPLFTCVHTRACAVGEKRL